MNKREVIVSPGKLQEIQKLELATVIETGQLRYRYDLINAYQSIGMHREAINELNRIALIYSDDPDVLAKQLLFFAEQQLFRQLSQFMKRRVFKVKEPSPGLALALARSFSLIGCREEGIKYYDQYLRTKDTKLTTEILEQLAEFVAKGPVPKEFAQLLIQVSKSETESSSNKLWNYILSRLYTDAHDYFLSENYLFPLIASEIDNKYIGFDLSLVIFRMADLKSTKQMVKRVLEIDPDYKPAQNFLVSVYSFLGDLEKASSMLKRHSLSSQELSLNQQQMNAVVEYALHGKHPVPCSNIIDINPSIPHDYSRNFSHKDDYRSHIKEQCDLKTVSCFGSGLDKGANPWEILMSIDRKYPHIMVQKYKECLRLHGFLASRDSVLWPWQEVAISIDADEGSFNIPIEHLKASKENFTQQEVQTNCDKLTCFEDELLQNPFLILEEHHE